MAADLALVEILNPLTSCRCGNEFYTVALIAPNMHLVIDGRQNKTSFGVMVYDGLERLDSYVFSADWGKSEQSAHLGETIWSHCQPEFSAYVQQDIAQKFALGHFTIRGLTLVRIRQHGRKHWHSAGVARRAG